MKSSRERITIARTNLVIDHPFFGVLALRLGIVEDNSMPTMWTDGEVIGFNDSFVRALTMAQLMACVAHEVLHDVLGHQWRRDGRDPERWNHAADFAINPIVVASKTAGSGGLQLELPAGCLLDPQYAGKSAEWIYAHLKSNGGGGGKGKPGKAGAAGDGKGTCCDGVRDAKDTSPSEQEWHTMANEAANAARQAGKLPGGLEQFIEGLNEAKINWRDVLRRFVQENVLRNDYTWRRPNSRYAALDIYLPSSYSEATPPIAVAFDTSGSISDAELKAFISELQSIIDEVKPEIVYSIQCDAQVTAEHVEYTEGDMLGKVKIHGRGGTRFEPVFDYIDAHDLRPACLVYLTDLEGSFPAVHPDYPTLWVSVNKGKAPFGETIHLDDGGGA
jgi:predicted metal-dependent peptidase